ncbi:MAG: tetratricopeptide repeat protein [Cyanobacteria bacterium J06621_8]
MANNSPNLEHIKSAWQEKYRAKQLLQNTANPDWQLQQGNQFLAQNQPLKAIACYRRALQLNPSHERAQQQLSAALKQHKLAKASTNYSQTVNPPNRPGHSLVPASNQQTIAEIYLQQAHAYELQGEWQQAINACQLALNFNSQLAPAYKTWGDNLLNIGNLTDALGCYGKALAIKPDFAAVYLNLGSLSVRQQQWQQALKYYQQAVAIDRSCVEGYRNLARVYKKLNQTQLMVQNWFQALQLAPQQANTEEHLNLAEVMQTMGETPKAIACYQQALKLQPQEINIYLKLGELLLGQNLNQEAIKLYLQSLKHFPSHSELNFRLAHLLESAHPNEAMVYYQQAIAADGSRWQGYWHLGQCLVRQQDYPGAISCYQKVGQLAPQHPEVFSNLAALQIKTQQWIKVVQTCRQGLNLNPQQVILYQYLGTALLNLKQYDVAIKVFTRHLQLDSAATDSYRQLALALTAESRWSEAIKCYQQILVQEPNCGDSLRKLGEAAAKAGEWEMAVSAWSQLIKLQGDEPWAYHHLGMALLSLEKWSEAIEALQRSIKLNPDFPWSYYHLGDALAKQQRWQESSVAYRDFLAQESCAYGYERLGDNLVRQIEGRDNSSQLLHQEAEACYYRAIEVEPDYLQPYYKLMELRPYDAELCFLLAETYARDKKEATAIIFYKIGLGINSDFPQAHFELGLVLERQQQLPQAIAHYQSAVRLNPVKQLYQSHLTQALSKQQGSTTSC